MFNFKKMFNFNKKKNKQTKIQIFKIFNLKKQQKNNVS